MKVLIIGGSGMIGSHAAAHLSALGHEISVSARVAKPDEVAPYPQVIGDYVAQSFTAAQLSRFDAIVFAAGQDVRHKGAGQDDAEFWRAAQIEGVPALARLARDAGVGRFVQIGSYYHQVMPQLAGTSAYVRARQLADENTRALAAPGFNVATLNPPSIVGTIPGPSTERYRGLVAWARGERPDIPDFAPAGGTNYMSAASLAEAIAGAIDNAESGHAYLIGDENLSYRDFFQRIFDAAGSTRTLESRDEQHPMLPDNYIIHGRAVTLAYAADESRRALGYRTGDITRAIGKIVARIDA
ncbi:NAD(P)-dependent oxidoreductase [Sphingomonas sp. So64.6b]|nr:NAD(P)-dependent oxidoreductase [Sphingomonas sp. So64.6b]